MVDTAVDSILKVFDEVLGGESEQLGQGSISSQEILSKEVRLTQKLKQLGLSEEESQQIVNLLMIAVQQGGSNNVAFTLKEKIQGIISLENNDNDNETEGDKQEGNFKQEGTGVTTDDPEASSDNESGAEAAISDIPVIDKSQATPQFEYQSQSGDIYVIGSLIRPEITPLGVVAQSKMGSRLPHVEVTALTGDASSPMILGKTSNIETTVLTVDGQNSFVFNSVEQGVESTTSDTVTFVPTISTITVPTNDSLASISATSLSVLEGRSGLMQQLSFMVTRTNGFVASSLDWAVSGEGIDEIDFGGFLPSGTIHFAANEISRAITFDVAGDRRIESDEIVTVELSNPSANLQLDVTSASTTVNNDDATVLITTSTPVVIEGTDGISQIMSFTVSRDNSLSASTVDWALSGVSADKFSGTLPSGQIVFSQGDSSQDISFTIAGDEIIELDENWTVTLSQAGDNLNLSSTADSVTAVVNDDDGLVSISATSLSVLEGHSDSTQQLVFELTRSNGYISSSVDWAISGTGIDASDFGGVLPSGTAIFAENEILTTIVLTLSGDRLIEADEIVSVQISNPSTNMVVGVASASTLILNDDTGVGIVADSIDVVEGQSGSQAAVTFTVIRSENFDQTLDLDYKIIPSGSDSADSSDFVAGQDGLTSNSGRPSGVVHFGISETSVSVTFYVEGDDQVELNETYSIILANAPAGTQILFGELTGKILSDEMQYSISTVTATTLEGNDTAGILQFLVTRVGDTSISSSVDFTVSGYGENPATASDFSTAMLGTVSFLAGETSKTITLDVVPDSDLEGNEAIEVNLVATDLSSIIITGTATATILPDDASITINADNSYVKEGTVLLQPHSFTVTRSDYLDSEVTLTWSLVASGINPVDVNDFGGILPSGTITFAANETSKNITVTPSLDSDFESNESYDIVLVTNQSGVVLLSDTSAGMVLNDDAGLTLVATAVDQNEGNPGDTPQISFSVQRSGDVTGESSVHWQLIANTVDGVSTADFTGAAVLEGDLTFTRGVSSLLVNIPLQTDNIIEADEGFSIVLSNASAGTEILVSEINGFIRNDDAMFNMLAGNTVSEGDSGTTVVTVTVERTGDLTGIDSFDYIVTAASTGNAISADDFVGGLYPSGTVSFAANETFKDIEININADSTLEADEGLTITISNPSLGSTIDNDTADIVIANDDDYLTIAATSADIVEGATASTSDMTFTITRSGNITSATTVDWVVTGTGGNPVNASDFDGGVLPSGTVSFAANETSKLITITLAGDASNESDESLIISLSSASAGTEIGTATATGIVRNDDTGVSISATTTDLTEGDGGTQTHEFTVTRSGILSGSTTVQWSVAGSSSNAAGADDFIGGIVPSGTLVFNTNEFTKTISVQTTGDTSIESTEGFTVTLTGVDGNAEIQTATASGTIVADDIGIAVSAGASSVIEGASGATQVISYTLTRVGDLASAVKIDWVASGLQAADFTGGTALSGSVDFSINEITKTVNFTLAGDNDYEGDETLTLSLTNPSDNPSQLHTAITTATATTQIIDDDAALVIAADNASLAEGDTGGSSFTAFSFTITRSGDITVATDIDWVVQLPGGDGSAALADFVAGQDGLTTNGDLPSGTVSFAIGETSKIITVNVATDDFVEQDETFNVVIQNAGDNTELSTAIASTIITNDDTGFTLTAIDSIKLEGDSGATPYTFDVTRAGAISSAATVDWVVSGAAVSGADFTGGVLPSGTLSFAANEESKTLTISVVGDTTVENNEDFTVTISNAKLADNTVQTIVTNTATGTINNDDESFAVTAANTTIAEGSSGTTPIAFTVDRTGDLTGTSTINYVVTGGTGTDANDIDLASLPSGTLTFGDGVAQLAVTFDVLGDTLVENDEVYTLTLSNASDGFISQLADTTTVTNDDTHFVLTAPSATYEGTSGTTEFQFTVTRTGDTTGTGSVSWKLSSATGLTTGDFVGSQDGLGTNSGLPSGSVNFIANATSATITINVQGDLTLENDEALVVVLSSPTSGTIEGTDGQASSTLLTDDDSFSISAGSTSQAEGNSDSTLTYTVTRSGSLVGARDLTWTITGTNGFNTGTDLASGQVSTGTVSFADGVDTATISVNILGDSTVESTEKMTVTLSAAPDNSSIATSAASTDLTNDDASVSIATLLADKNEGNSGYVDFTFTVTRSGFTTQSTTVDWAVDASVSNPVDGSDFYSTQLTGVSVDGDGIPYGSLTFSSGETSKVITLRVNGDSVLESDEVLKIDLSNASSGTEVGTASATGAVRNDDAELNITAGTASKVEGDAGHGTGVAYTYTVTRTGNLTQVTTVDWDVSHGTTSSSDFTNGTDTLLTPSGSLTFSSGESSKTVTVYAYGDTGVGSVEDDETFSLVLSGANAGSSIGSTGSFDSTIANDDTTLTLSVDDYSKAEGKAGETTTYTYTVTRTGDVSGATSYTWSTGNTNVETGQTGYVYDYIDSGYWYPSSTSDFDGGVYSLGSGSFSANQTTDTFTVSINGDDVAENAESFFVKVIASSGYDEINVVYDNPDVADNTQLLRSYYSSNYYYDNVHYSSAYNGVSEDTNYLYSKIERDEAEFKVLDREVTAEGNHTLLSSHYEGDTAADGGSDDLVAHIFAVQRTVATSGTAWVTWRAVNYDRASADDFADGSDARSLGGSVLASGTVNFVDGQDWGYITVYTKPDDVGEYDEIFHVYLDGVSGGSSIHTSDDGYPYNYGYITNDDTRFDASVNDVTEGGVLTYTVTRSGDSRGTDTVDWSITFPGSETTSESKDTTSTWYDADPSDISTVVPTNGSAAYDSGSRTYSGTLTFTDGETSKTITVQTLDDSWAETWVEELPITLSNATNVDNSETNHDLETAVTGYTDTARIYDNEPDQLLTVTSDVTELWEGSTFNNNNAAGNAVTFTITRTDTSVDSGAGAYPVTVGWKLDGYDINNTSVLDEVFSYTGDALNVYTGSTGETYGVVTFASDEFTKEVIVTFTGDSYADSNRDLIFTVASASTAESSDYHNGGGNPDYGSANTASSSGESVTVTLNNDDIRLYVNGWDTSSPYDTNLSVSAYEGEDLTFNVIRGGRLDTDVTVGYSIITGTATAGDFSSTSGTFVLAAQSSNYSSGYTYNISLADVLGDDTVVESTENFTLRLTVPADTAGETVTFQSYYTNQYSTPSTTLDLSGTIYDEDTTYTLTPASTSLSETDDGSDQTFSFTVERTAGYTGVATLKWRVEAVGGEPTDSSDFTTSDGNGDNSGLPSGTVSFANGVTTGNFSVFVNGDLIAENNETFRVVLYEDVLTDPNPDVTNSLSIATANLTIVTDDAGLSIADALITESDATQTLSFTVTRSGDLSGTSSADWTLNYDTAVAADITGATSGSISFAANGTTATINIGVVGDITPESAESFTVLLSNLVGVNEAIDVSAVGLINNDDSAFSISAGGTAIEGSGQTFTIARTHDTVQDQTINWEVSAGDVDTTDFSGLFPTGSVVFAQGEMSKEVVITSNNDATPEVDEDYVVTISLGTGTTGDTIITGTATGTIINNDAAYYIVTDQASKQEGHTGTSDFTFTVSRTGNATGVATVDWNLSSSGANATDFTTTDGLGTNSGLPSGTLSFSDGVSEQTITIQVTGDLDVESDEDFTLTLSNSSSGTILGATANTTIVNDDSTIAIAATNAVQAEGNSGATAFTFTVTRTGSLAEAETVDYAITGSSGSPANAADFNGGVLTTGTLTLAANQTDTVLTVYVNGDLEGESDEEFTVSLTNPSTGVSITTATVTGTIQADDIVFDVSTPVTQLEGNPGDTNYYDFDVTRTGLLTGSQTLTWTITGVTSDPASASEFEATTGTVTFNATDTSKTISVGVLGDYLGEANEGFRLTLTGPDGIAFVNDTADVTITDDEASLRINTTDAVKAEGESGATSYTFTVTRTGNETLVADVDWAIVSAGDTDSSDFDGASLPSGSLSFANGETSKVITVDITGDTNVESNENFTVQLSNASTGADIVTGTAIGTIISDDSEWTISTLTIPSGEGDASNGFVFRVSRTGGELATTMNWSSEGSGSNQAATSDFLGGFFPSGTLTFAEGVNTQDFTITVAGDSAIELDETFTVSLSEPADSLTHSFAVQSVETTIINDDDEMSISALNSNQAEGTDSSTDFTFTVTRTGSTEGASTVGWRIVHGSTDASDFVATSGTVSFADGVSEQILSVAVEGDRDVETDQSFSVELYNPGTGSSVASGATASADGVIQNDDVDLALSATSSGSVIEGDTANPGQISYTVTRTGDLSVTTTVNWSVVAGTAIATDFLSGVLPSGALTFIANESSKVILIDLAGDGIDEGDESFTVQLSGQSSHANISINNVEGIIANDDDTLSLSDVTVSHDEGDSGTTSYSFTVTRTGTSLGATSVDWQVAGSGTNPAEAADFDATSGTVSLADGEASKTFTVLVSGDTTGEFDETFELSLTNPTYGSSVTSITAEGLILNDDAALSITADQVSKLEGGDGVETIFNFTVTRSGDISGSSSALWNVISSGSQFADALDFGGVYPSGAVAFLAGQTTQTISVSVFGDLIGEYDETFSVVLSAPANATIISSTAQTSITNDDTGVSIAALDAEKVEGNDGDVTDFTFRVDRVGDLSSTTVAWSVAGIGIYPAGADDFVGGNLPSGNITFADGETYRDITIQVAGDDTFGDDQTFKVVLTGDNIINNEANGVIVNDDSQMAVAMAVGSVSKIEGNSGFTTYSFVVTRTGADNQIATIDWEVVGFGGQQADANDFGGLLPTGSLEFADGETSKTVAINVSADTETELDEVFAIQLINSGAGVSVLTNDSYATATIETDDVGVVLIGLDVDREEGNLGTQTAFTYQVLRSGSINESETINYTITGNVDQDDFITPLTGSFFMAAGISSQSFTLYVKGDGNIEDDEEFQVTLSSSNLTIEGGPVDSVIRDDESGISISSADTAVQEGSDGSTTSITFDVDVVGISVATTVNWTIESLTGKDVNALDFSGGAIPSGSLLFNTDGTQSVTLQLTHDDIVEYDEVLTVVITSTGDVPVRSDRITISVTNDDAISEQDDFIEGDALGNTIDALDGNDVIYGFAGGDNLSGGKGNDTLYGGEGSDVLSGGAGQDRFVYESPSHGMDIIDDFESGTDQIGFVSSAFGNITGSITSVKQAFDTDVSTTLQHLADTTASSGGSIDLYQVSFDSSFSFGVGGAGQLDELEASITSSGQTGPAFVLVSDGQISRMYYDADTSSGTDGSGLMAIAELTSVTDAASVVEPIIEHSV